MNYIFRELRAAFWPYFILSWIFGFAPWAPSTYMVNVVGTFLGAYVVLVLWIIARTIWLTFYRRLPNNDK